MTSESQSQQQPQFNRRSIKYWLFDVAVTVSLVSGVCFFSRGDRNGSPSDVSSSETSPNSVFHGFSSSSTLRATRARFLKDLNLAPSPDETDSSDNKSSATAANPPIAGQFQVGDIVEIRNPDKTIPASFAYAAQIKKVIIAGEDGVDGEGNYGAKPVSIKYDVLPGINGELLTNVDASHVFAMEVYPYKSEAMCHFEEVVPCMILEPSTDKCEGSGGCYNVRYVRKSDGDRVTGVIALSKIERLVRNEQITKEGVAPFVTSAESVRVAHIEEDMAENDEIDSIHQ